MKFIVAQIGARHHYAVPRMLARQNYLASLYTDSSVNQGIGRLLNIIVPKAMRRGSLDKLLQRRIAGVPSERIRSTDNLLWSRFFHRKSDSFTDQVDLGASFSHKMIRWGTADATHVYSMFGEGLEFLHFAKKRGLKICVDMFITPIAHRIIADERTRFPEWEGEPKPLDPRLEPRIREIIDLADFLLCPGGNVVDGLKAFGDHSAKVRLVPYGSGADFKGRTNRPIVGRILFAGTAELRKGIHYFAAAAEKLKSQGFDFRVAGDVTHRIRRLPQCNTLNFLGRISRAEMVEEFLQADVLVLPTLAEGSASVVNEGLVAGLPVISTLSAGSEIFHNRNGALVGERNSDALANEIKRVVLDRTRREGLAAGARQISDVLSEGSWSKRLLAAVAS